jgi:hypothetical protein
MAQDTLSEFAEATAARFGIPGIAVGVTLLYMSSTCQAAWVECCGVMSLSTAKISRAT